MSSKENRRVELSGPNGTFSVVEGSIPSTPKSGLVLKIDYAGICHSDIHIWHNSFKISDDASLAMNTLDPTFWDRPRVLGHEIFGRVMEFGDDVGTNTEGLSIGDRVVVFAWTHCGQCGYCQLGYSNVCSYPIKDPHNSPGIMNDGGFQDYLAMSSPHYACKLPDTIPGEIGCLLGCSGLTAYSACQKALDSIEVAVKAKGSANILVIGSGGLGQWAISIAKAFFPKGTKIFAADVSEKNLELAKDLEATPILWPIGGEDAALIQTTKELTGGGVDAAIDFVGSTVTAERGFMCCNRNSTLVLVGLFGGTLKCSIFEAIHKNIKICGNYCGDLSSQRELIEFCDKHPEVRGPKVTLVQPGEVGTVFVDLAAGKFHGRAVIDMTV